MPDLNLHVGFHKTATTHFQHALERATWSTGTRYVSLVESRRTLPVFFAQEKRTIPDYMTEGGQDVFISEENICGWATHALKGYPSVGEAIKSVVDIGEWERVRIFFSIRAFSTWVPSAYAEALRLWAVQHSWDHLYYRPWREIIAEVKQKLPEADYYFWTFEDYIGNPALFVEKFSGGNAVLVNGGTQVARPSPPKLAIEIMEILGNSVKVKQRGKLMDTLSNYARENGLTDRFRPLNASSIAQLDADYQLDLDALKEIATRIA